jgi:hypothetical protein
MVPGLVGELHSPPEIVSLTTKESSLEYIEDFPLAPAPVSSDVAPDKLSSGDVMDGNCELRSIVSSILSCKTVSQSAGKLLCRSRLSLPSCRWFPNLSAAGHTTPDHKLNRKSQQPKRTFLQAKKTNYT